MRRAEEERTGGVIILIGIALILTVLLFAYLYRGVLPWELPQTLESGFREGRIQESLVRDYDELLAFLPENVRKKTGLIAALSVIAGNALTKSFR